MKKVLLWLSVLVISISMVMAISLTCCKESVAAEEGPFIVAFVPSVIGIPFFALESEGFKEALSEFGDKLIYLGPEKGTPEEEIEIINNLIIQGVDAINFVPTDPEAINTVSKQAMDAGIKMLENGSPNMKGYVDISVIIFAPDDVGRILMETAAELIDYKGQFAILSAAATSTAQNEWIAGIKKEFKKSEYSDMELVTIVYGDDIREKSYNEAVGLLKSYPDLRCILSPTSVGIAAAGRVITDKGMIDKVELTGLGLPSEMAEYCRNGACKKFAIWNPIDLGYFNAMVAHYLCTGEITGSAGEKFTAGRLGDYEIEEDGIVTFSRIFYFDIDNIDEWAEKF